VTIAYVGDTLIFADTLVDANGDPVDLTGATVTIDVREPSGRTNTKPGTAGDDPGEVTARLDPPSDQEVGNYGGMWRVSNGTVASYPATPIVVVDPACMWAHPADVFAVIGPKGTAETVTAIVAAQALLSSAFCTEIPCDAVPPTVTAATALIAARLLTRPKPGETVVTSETIGDYTYRSAAPQRVEASELITEVRDMVYPYLCGWARSEGTIKSPRVWPDVPCCPTCGLWALPLLGGCGCDPLGEYQPDAEGFMRS
jgi:hypothetical protein